MAQVGDLLVRVRADIKDLNRKLDRAAQKTKKSSDKMTKSLKGTSKASSQLQKRFSNTATAIAALQGPLGPLAGRVRSIGALFGSAGLAIAAVTLAVTLLIAGFRKMIMAAEAANLAMIKFEALVKATGMAAGYTAKEMERLSISLAKATLFNVTEVREASAVLLTFKAIAGEAFERTMKVAMNLSSVVGTDLKSSILQLGKALEAPEIGLSMLRRSGVSFTTSQRDVIVALSETGKKGDALRLILEQIEGQLGNVAEDMAGSGGKLTMSGAMDELGRKLQLFNEQFLKSSGIIQWFTDKIEYLADIIPVIDITSMDMSELDLSLAEMEAKLENAKRLMETYQKWGGGLIATGAGMVAWKVILGNISRYEENIIKIKEAMDDLANTKAKQTFDEMNKAFEEGKLFLDDWVKKNNLVQQGLQHTAARFGVFGAELEMLKYKQKLYVQLMKKGIVVTDEIRIAIDKLAEHLRPLQEELAFATEAYGEIDKAVNKAFSTMENSIIGLIRGTTTMKEVLRNIMQQFIADLTTSIIKMLVLNRLKEAIMGRVGKSFNLGSIFSMFGGPDISGVRAQGGTVASKTPYIVGEKGPELFIPNTSGRVAPNGSFGGGGGTPPIVVEQHINFATGIQPTVRAEVMNLLPQIQNSTIAAVQEARVRGGKFAESFGG